jgi:hypothetical protein
MEWSCKRCERDFGPEARQFRVSYSRQSGGRPQIGSIELHDPDLDGVVALRVPNPSDIARMPGPTRDLLRKHAGLVAGPVWYCEECFKENFPKVS